jgi:hypothetical protein
MDKNNMIINGNLDLNNSNIESLGDLEKVDGTIYIHDSGITKEYMKKYKPQFYYR